MDNPIGKPELNKLLNGLRDLLPNITKADVRKGGPGSGRYPAGSGKGDNEVSRTQDVRAKDYINAIKNPNKKAYAEAYNEYLKHGQSGSNVAEPNVRDYGLSYMGAQSVRIALGDVHRSVETTGADLESKQEELQSQLRNQGMHQSDALDTVAAMSEEQIDAQLAESQSSASRQMEEGRHNDPEFTPDEELRDRLSDPSYGAKATKSDIKKVVDFVRDNITKGGPGSGRYPAGSGGNTASSAQRYNDRADRMYAEARKLELERLLRGEEPNPNLTATVSSRTHIAGEHKILEVKGPDGQPRYVTDYKPSQMFSSHESARPLGVHNSLEDAERQVQEHKDSLIAEHNVRAKEQKSVETGDFNKYISHSDGKWTVHSESGKPMGTYDSEAGAKKRLQQIEYFKNVKKSFETFRDLLAKDSVNKDVMNSYPNPVYRGETKLPPILEDSKPTEEGKIRISGDTSGQGGIGPGGTGIGAGGAGNPK